MRTDQNQNPAAFTTSLAEQAGLEKGVDWIMGDPFTSQGGGGVYYTARLIGDPVAITVRLIDAVGYYTHAGQPRWNYIAIPKFLWDSLTPDEKRDVVGFHYQREGGTAMRDLFPNYGKV